MSEHTEDGQCWCDDMGRRAARLDEMFPDRCRIVFEPGETPHGGHATCVLPSGHERPCFGHLERPGGPCHFCGATYDGDRCSDCWTSLDGMNLADLKGIFAGIDLSIEAGSE